MKKILLLVAFIASFVSLSVSAQEKHELENMRVSVPATAYKSSRFLENGTNKNKDYIQGKKSSYNKKGESANKKTLAPYAEYSLSSKLAGGTYEVTVYYTLDKKNTPDEPIVIVGLDLLEGQEMPIKNKLVNSVKADFKVKTLRGKNHTLKLWLPSQGVQVNKIDVRRKLINGK